MYEIGTLIWISCKICTLYQIILNLILFVIASTIHIKCNTFRYHKCPYPGRNYRKISIFTSIWTERTLTQRCRSISKLVRYYLQFVGNFSYKLLLRFRPCHNHLDIKIRNELKKMMGVKFHITSYCVWALRTSKRGVLGTQKFNFLQKWPNLQVRLELTWRSFFA